MSNRLEARVPEFYGLSCAMAVSSSDVPQPAGSIPGADLYSEGAVPSASHEPPAFMPIQDTQVFRLLQARVQVLESSLDLTRKVALAACPKEALESIENRLSLLERRVTTTQDASAGSTGVSHESPGAGTLDLASHRRRLAAAGQLDVHPLGPLLHALPLLGCGFCP